MFGLRLLFMDGGPITFDILLPCPITFGIFPGPFINWLGCAG